MIVTHSHPVDPGNGETPNNHNHTKTEICLYSNIHFDFYTISPEIHFENYDIPDFKNCISYNEDSNYKFLIPQKKLRGPPSFQVL